MTAKQKREAYARIASGEVSVVIGTHALIQEKVQYQNLALVITDEQHRFGVRQRETLSKKGAYPHTIVMSATPIPQGRLRSSYMEIWMFPSSMRCLRTGCRSKTVS